MILSDKSEVNEFNDELFGHDGEVFEWVFREIVIEPFFGVFFDGSD